MSEPAPSAPTIRGPYRNGIKRRKEIVESAARIFGAYGYAGGSLRQIAGEVGVTPAALMRHFASKEALLMAVLVDWDNETDKQRPSSMCGLDRFLSLPGSVEQHTNDPGLLELFLRMSAESTNQSHPASEFMRNRYERVLDEALVDLKKARDDGEIRHMSDEDLMTEVHGVYALMDGIQLQWLLNRSIDVVGAFRKSLGEMITSWTGAEPTWPETAPRVAEPEVG